MSEIKLTKNELRSQQERLGQLNKYLPTLQLKKAMLQAEVSDVKLEVQRLETAFESFKEEVKGFSALLPLATGVAFENLIEVKVLKKEYENIAGVEIPIYKGVDFQDLEYSLFETPPWLDGAVHKMRQMTEGRAQLLVADEKKRALEAELREVSIRVNLFEKILIPRATANIKKIKIFLGDQELAAVSQAKVAKTKIELRKPSHQQELSHAC